MAKYRIFLSPIANRDIESIYDYIANKLQAPDTAINLVDSIQDAIFSLENNPMRDALRKVGVYADKGYRQRFIKNYIIVYIVDEETKSVVIHTIRFAPSNF